jgi:hypothetical protein
VVIIVVIIIIIIIIITLSSHYHQSSIIIIIIIIIIITTTTATDLIIIIVIIIIIIIIITTTTAFIMIIINIIIIISIISIIINDLGDLLPVTKEMDVWLLTARQHEAIACVTSHPLSQVDCHRVQIPTAFQRGYKHHIHPTVLLRRSVGAAGWKKEKNFCFMPTHQRSF